MGSLLETVEKTSMFCGLEVKVFFVSHRLLEYVFNMPFEFKFCNNLSKGILRKSAKKHLLHEVVDKKNFEDFLKNKKITQLSGLDN